MSAEKTEKPTAKKLRDARKKGQIPRSREVVSAGVLLVFAVLLWGASNLIISAFGTLGAMAFEPIAYTGTLPELAAWIERVARWGALALVIVAAIELASGAFTGFLQTRGLVISFDPIMPKFERLNPAQNVKQMFSRKQLFDVVRKLLLIVLLGCVMLLLFRSLLAPLAQLAYDPAALPQLTRHALLLLLGICTAVAVVAALADYGLQVFGHLRDQRMTKDEVRREHKDSEGDPYIKGMRRALQREMANTPGAVAARPSVVIANPTHVAVALYYERGGPPPRCLSKALDGDALRLRRAAEREGVPVLEDPPLARRLYRDVAVDDFIDASLFDVIADVLAWAESQSKASAHSDAAAVNQPFA